MITIPLVFISRLCLNIQSNRDTNKDLNFMFMTLNVNI